MSTINEYSQLVVNMPFLWRQLLDKMFISSCHKYMPSRPLLISPIHRVNSSSRPVYLKVSSSHLVVSSSHLVESSSHLVVWSSHLVVSSFLTYCLVVPLLVYSSTRRITFQLVVLPFNSSCRLSTSCNDLVHCSWDLRDLGTTTKQSNMAAVEPVDELKECLRASVEMLLDKLNDRLHEDMDGVDRIQNLVERASGLYDIPLEIVDILRSAQDSLRSLATGKKESWVFNSTGCRGRPSFHIPQDMLQLYLYYQFSLAKIGQIFGVSSKTIQRRITEYDLKKVDFTNVSDNELDNQM